MPKGKHKSKRQDEDSKDDQRIASMRMLMTVTIPHEPFNTLVRQGTAGELLGRILEETRPEAVYFTEQNGKRGAILVVSVKGPSHIPTLAEPWFLNFSADCEFHVVMSPDELQGAGLDDLGKKWA